MIELESMVNLFLVSAFWGFTTELHHVCPVIPSRLAMWFYHITIYTNKHTGLYKLIWNFLELLNMFLQKFKVKVF